MADTKISGLSAGAPAQAGDLIPIARSGANYSITPANILAYGTSPVAGTSGTFSTTLGVTGITTLGAALVGPATATVFNTVSTTVNAFGAASTALNMGHASATNTLLGVSNFSQGVNGTLGATTPAAATVTTLGASGGITSTKVNAFLTATPVTGTASVYQLFNNSGGPSYIGQNDSTGGDLLGGAYSMTIQAASGRTVVQAITGTGAITTTSSTGLAVTGTLSATGATSFSNGYKQSFVKAANNTGGSSVATFTFNLTTNFNWLPYYVKVWANATDNLSNTQHTAWWLYNVTTVNGSGGNVALSDSGGDTAAYSISLSGNSASTTQAWTLAITATSLDNVIADVDVVGYGGVSALA